MTVGANIVSLSGLACVHESLCFVFHTGGSLSEPNVIPEVLGGVNLMGPPGAEP